MSLDRFLASQDLSVEAAIDRLNQSETQILLVVDENRNLLGTVTDGDVRRAILASQRALSEIPILEVMQRAPTVAAPDWSPQRAQSLMHAKKIHHVPIVDDHGVVTGIFTAESLFSNRPLPNIAFVLAGGLGTRLGEMTRNCPKPMLRVGGKPILETIVESLRDAGIQRIVLAVNYLADQIQNYFGDGSNHKLDIQYVVERERLGTVGAIRYLEPIPQAPVLVMNGDLLTRINYGHLLRYHEQHEAEATMCVREYNQRIPFGVVELSGNQIESIQEKPETSFFVNSGIYVLSPSALRCIPSEGSYNMTCLFDELRRRSLATVAYPIQEYWADIGQPDDFEQAEFDYAVNFNHCGKQS